MYTFVFLRMNNDIFYVKYSIYLEYKNDLNKATECKINISKIK